MRTLQRPGAVMRRSVRESISEHCLIRAETSISDDVIVIAGITVWVAVRDNVGGGVGDNVWVSIQAIFRRQ